MPTTRPRHTLTETDTLARALDEAANEWPEDSPNRSRLLARIVEAWLEQRDREWEALVARRRKAIRESSGKFTGMYPPGYLEELRKDWPD